MKFFQLSNLIMRKLILLQDSSLLQFMLKTAPLKTRLSNSVYEGISTLCSGCPGKELYSRNLSLLVPFFEDPSIQLKKIEKGISSKTEFIVASWTLRTYLKLPWKPFIYIDGKTVYDLDEQFRIVRHVESWNISALEAIGQIFTPSFGRPNK